MHASRSLRRLRDDRLVASRRGAGTTVIPPSSPDSYVHEVTSFNDLITFATGVRFAIDTMEIIEADAKLASRIGGAAADRWLAVRGASRRYGDASRCRHDRKLATRSRRRVHQTSDAAALRHRYDGRAGLTERGSENEQRVAGRRDGEAPYIIRLIARYPFTRRIVMA